MHDVIVNKLGPVIPTRARWCGISDLSFQRRPALATILYGIEVPRLGGDTLYADMYAAYDALDQETGRKILYISRHVSHFVGMPRAESDALLERLLQHSTQDRFVFRHRWGQRDVVMWDNRCTMHCATPYDAGAERRVLHRTVVIGEAPA